MKTIHDPAGRRTRGRPSVEDEALIEAQILDVALNEFVQHGYGASMSKIVRAAGISKTTLYSRFASKEDLFRAIIKKQIDRVAETMPLGPPKDRYDIGKGLKNFANRTLEVSLEPSFIEVNRLIYSEAGRFPELGGLAAERNAIGVAQLAEFIRYRAEIDKVSCRDPETVAEVLIMVMRGWYQNVMLTDQLPSFRERTDWIDRSVDLILASRADW